MIYNKYVIDNYMNTSKYDTIEEIQRLVVRTLAVNPAGHNLFLIGGFRYRFLNGSVRRSVDIDYHWEGDLAEKQREVVSLFRRKLLPEVKRQLGYSGDIFPGREPGEESEEVRTVELAFYREGVAYSRIEIPVDITVTARLDLPEVRTEAGVVYPTLSDADLVENKVLAAVSRIYPQARDFIDIFLFQSSLRGDAPRRIAEKMKELSLAPATVERKLKMLEENSVVYVKGLERVIEEQIDPAPAQNLKAAGGAATVFGSVLIILRGLLNPKEPGSL